MTHQPSDNDLAFHAQFESCEFPASDFAHLRLACIYLTNAGDSLAVVDPTDRAFDRPAVAGAMRLAKDKHQHPAIR